MVLIDNLTKLKMALSEINGVTDKYISTDPKLIVWFDVDTLDHAAMRVISRSLDLRYGSPVGWVCILDHKDDDPGYCFRLEGPAGDYFGAGKLANNLQYQNARYDSENDTFAITSERMAELEERFG